VIELLWNDDYSLRLEIIVLIGSHVFSIVLSRSYRDFLLSNFIYVLTKHMRCSSLMLVVSNLDPPELCFSRCNQ